MNFELLAMLTSQRLILHQHRRSRGREGRCVGGKEPELGRYGRVRRQYGKLLSGRMETFLLPFCDRQTNGHTREGEERENCLHSIS